MLGGEAQRPVSRPAVNHKQQEMTTMAVNSGKKLILFRNYCRLEDSTVQQITLQLAVILLQN